MSVVSAAVLGGLAAAALFTDVGRASQDQLVGDPVDEVWVLMAGCLVFFMQAGFLMFEVGLARPAHITAVALKNVMDWAVGSVAFFFVGFGVMFGTGVVAGTEYFALDGLPGTAGSVSGLTFYLFQMAFAGTTITLISGSLVERTSFVAYVSFSTLVGLLIYPVYGHWVWGGLLVAGNEGWLAALGFHDFAGGTVVHTTGAWAALVGIIMVGPRMGRFRSNGTVQVFAPSNIPMTALGVLILWLGWFGFNGGSTLGLTLDVPRIILVTNLAGVAGTLAGGAYAQLMDDGVDITGKILGGAVAGLVAITPGADVVPPVGAIVIGLVAGIIYAVGYEQLLRLRIDDALGVVPAHGFAAVWGTLALVVFAPEGTFARPLVEQVGVQALGLVVNLGWVVAISILGFGVLKATIGLRVSPHRERHGVDMEVDDRHGASWADQGMTEHELAELLD